MSADGDGLCMGCDGGGMFAGLPVNEAKFAQAGPEVRQGLGRAERVGQASADRDRFCVGCSGGDVVAVCELFIADLGQAEVAE